MRRIQTFTEDERYRRLARFLQSREPAEPTSGYRALAALCAEGYFDVILTTNLDPLLDDALAAAKLWRRDYLLLVNGIVRPDRLEVVLRSRSPRVKIVKLHGDLFHRFMAWTPREMETFVDEVAPPLHRALNGRDILVVGHSLRDERIRRIIVDEANLVWYAHPRSVPDYLTQLDKLRAVVDPRCEFERLFPLMASQLNAAPATPVGARPAPASRARPSRASTKQLIAPSRSGRAERQPPEQHLIEPQAEARTVDDLMACVVALEGVLAGKPQKFCTAFALAEPRVIIGDALGLESWDPSRRFRGFSVVSADGRRFPAKLLRRNEAHPAGPIVLEIPSGLSVPGLRLDDRPLGSGDDVSIAVAAGPRVGISRAHVRDGREVSSDVRPVGAVDDLIALDGLVTGGSSGGPVVDGELRVRGFVVAGDQAPDRPTTLIYPARRWARFVRGGRGGRGASQSLEPRPRLVGEKKAKGEPFLLTRPPPFRTM